MRRLKILALPHKVKELFHPWIDDIIEAIGDRHDLALLDEKQPLAPQFEGVEVVIDHGGGVGTHEMMDAATDARLWQIHGTGFENFDLDYTRAKGIPVANCPGQFSSVALAETAMMFMLMLGHEYRKGMENFRSRTFYRPAGRELGGQNLGIIGFGASGQELARRAKPFGMRILAIDVRDIESEILDEIRPDFMGTPDDLDRVMAESDFISLHLHFNDETRHIIDAQCIALMKPTACIINVARGGLVDTSAMYEALIAGKLGGAGLDVFEEEPVDPTAPVFQLPNVVVLPHLAGATRQTSLRRAACTSENADRIAQDLEPLYRIDL
jgi:phosphoglycerate dehydrogenase-like enzyme